MTAAPDATSLVGEHRAASPAEAGAGETGRTTEGRPRPGSRGRPLGTLGRIRGQLSLPWRLGLELSAVIEGGLRILARIDAVGGDVFTRRPELRTRDWCAVAYHALVPSRSAAA